MTTIQTGATTKLNQHEIIPAKNDVGALANRINTQTKGQHDKINKAIVLKLALALRDAKIYRQGLQSFYHVFASIEEVLFDQFEKNPNGKYTSMLKQVWKPEMARAERARTDLLFYYDDNKSKFMNPKMSEQINFANHIKEQCNEKPYLLLAYLHVMYLALFAGGRIMRSSISKATGLFPQKDNLKHEEIIKLGANFFCFDVTDEDSFRLLYKRDYELATRNFLTEDQKQEIIKESIYIFEQNYKCVKELEKHNLELLTKKWSYIAATKGYYAAVVLLVVFFIYYLQKILSAWV